MFKKITPDKDRVMPTLGQFPHCDQRVLHAPGECGYCDRHPEWQALRIAWGIAFTGYEPEGNELPDPATHSRGLDKVNRWPGNTPVTVGQCPVCRQLEGHKPGCLYAISPWMDFEKQRQETAKPRESDRHD